MQALPQTHEIYRTKQGVLTLKMNNGKAPLVWYRGGKPIDVNDSRYVIENDSVGRFTLTIKDVEDADQGEWMARVSDEVFCKVLVNVEGKSNRCINNRVITFRTSCYICNTDEIAKS